MIIYCDYCGSQIDTDKYRTCPSCGSSYANDSELKVHNERQNKIEELNVRKKELEVDRMEIENDALRNRSLQSVPQNSDNKQRIGIGCLIPMILFAIFGVFFIVMIICVELDPKYSSDKAKESEQSRKTVNITYTLSKIDMPDISIPDISLSSGDTTAAAGAVQSGNSVICDGFTLTCESVTAVELPDYRVGAGNVCLLFHLVLENTGEKKLYPFNSVTCLRDGFVCSRVYSIEQKPFAYDAVPQGAKAEGYFCFEVAADCRSLTLVYNNSIELELAVPAGITAG